MAASLNFTLLGLLSSIFHSHIEARGSLCGNGKLQQGRANTLCLEVVYLGGLETNASSRLPCLLRKGIGLPQSYFDKKLENCIPLFLYYFLPAATPASLPVDFIPSQVLSRIIVQVCNLHRVVV